MPNYTLHCHKCDSYILVDQDEFDEYEDKLYICNRCLGIKQDQEYAIDSDIHSGISDKRKNVKGNNKKRRKGDCYEREFDI